MSPPSGAADQIEAFLEMMAVERAASPHTLAAYGRDLTDAEAFLAGRSLDLNRSDCADIEAYFEDLSARGLAPATAARRRAAVRQFYRFALVEGWRRTIRAAGGGAQARAAPCPRCSAGRRWRRS
jgi:integrase/recombinase XerD